MFNFSFNEKQKKHLETALTILQEELSEISKATISPYLRRGFADDATAVENLLYIVKQTPDEVMSDAVLRTEVLSYLNRGLKIEAIKFVRAQRNMGLKEAKDFVDNLQ